LEELRYLFLNGFYSFLEAFAKLRNVNIAVVPGVREPPRPLIYTDPGLRTSLSVLWVLLTGTVVKLLFRISGYLLPPRT